MVVSKRNKKSVKHLHKKRIHIHKKKDTKKYYNYNNYKNYNKLTVKGGASIEKDDKFSMIELIDAKDTEPIVQQLLETFEIKVISKEKSLKIVLINKEWVKKMLTLSEEKFGWLTKIGSSIAQKMANTIVFIFNFDNNNKIATQIISPIGMMQINGDGNLQLLGVKSWIIKKFIPDEIYNKIKEHIKANYPVFIQNIKEYIVFVKNNPNAFKYILYQFMNNKKELYELFNMLSNLPPNINQIDNTIISALLKQFADVLKTIDISNLNTVINTPIIPKINLLEIITQIMKQNGQSVYQPGSQSVIKQPLERPVERPLERPLGKRPGTLPPNQPPGKRQRQQTSPGKPSGQAPGNPPVQAPGKPSGQTPGKPPVQTPGKPSGQAPSQTPGKSTGQAPGQTPIQLTQQTIIQQGLPLKEPNIKPINIVKNNKNVTHLPIMSNTPSLNTSITPIENITSAAINTAISTAKNNNKTNGNNTQIKANIVNNAAVAPTELQNNAAVSNVVNNAAVKANNNAIKANNNAVKANNNAVAEANNNAVKANNAEEANNNPVAEAQQNNAEAQQNNAEVANNAEVQQNNAEHNAEVQQNTAEVANNAEVQQNTAEVANNAEVQQNNAEVQQNNAEVQQNNAEVQQNNAVVANNNNTNLDGGKRKLRKYSNKNNNSRKSKRSKKSKKQSKKQSKQTKYNRKNTKKSKSKKYKN